MMNEETYLKENVGTRNPFQVPDGYFEQLTQQVMQQLPERQPSVVQLFLSSRKQVTTPAHPAPAPVVPTQPPVLPLPL